MFKPTLEVLEDRIVPTTSNWGWLPPEINSALMYSGPGSGPMLSAAAAWNGLAAELQTAANSLEVVISSLSGNAWIGPASNVGTAAGSYEGALAATVPPPMVAANRALPSALVATNFLGQNTPAIAATEAHYTNMWAQDAAPMADQGGAGLASPNTGVGSASADEVSAAVAALFDTYGQTFQAVSSQSAAFHEQFIQILGAAGGQYANTESANPSVTG